MPSLFVSKCLLPVFATMVKAAVRPIIFSPFFLPVSLLQRADLFGTACIPQGLFDGSKPVNTLAAKFF